MQGNVHIILFQNKLQNPHKFPEIMIQAGFLATFIIEGTLTVFLISRNFSFIMCGAFERKEMWFLRIEKYNIRTW